MDGFSTAIVLILAGYLIAVGFLGSSTVTSTATINGNMLGIYWDLGCTQGVDSISWGTLYVGSSRTVSMHIRNEGEATIHLSLTTTDWQPAEASEVLSLDWNYDGRKLYPNEVVPIGLRLSLSPDPKGLTSFGFNIVMSPEEVQPSPPPSPPPPPVDRSPPSISVVSPESGAVVNGSSLLVRWVGRDSGTGIDRYLVFLNGELEVETKDTSYDLLELSDGLNNVTVKAYDKAGNKGEDGITVDVDRMAPTVSLLCQEGDKLRRTATLNFSAYDDNLAKMFLQIDGDVFDVTGSDSYVWNTLDVNDGAHRIRAIAVDEAGNINSSSISILVDNTEPKLTLRNLADGDAVSGLLNVQFSVLDLTPVDVLYSLDDEAAEEVTSAGSISLDTAGLEEGLHAIRFVLTDAVGNSFQDTISILVDNTLPSVDFVSPTNGSCLGGLASIVLAGDDANFDRIEFYIGDALAAKSHTNELRYDWNTEHTKDGVNILKARVYDKAGNIAERAIIAEVDNTAPDVSLISPSGDAGVSGICNIVFSASDSNLARILLSIDGSVFDVTGRNFLWWSTIGLVDGKHTISVRAVDEAGNYAVAQATVVTVSRYLILESIKGIAFIALVISVWPFVLSSKDPIV